MELNFQLAVKAYDTKHNSNPFRVTLETKHSEIHFPNYTYILRVLFKERIKIIISL